MLLATQPLWSLYPKIHLGRNRIKGFPHFNGDIHNKENNLVELHGNRAEAQSHSQLLYNMQSIQGIP